MHIWFSLLCKGFEKSSVPDKINQLGSISSDQLYEETETSECAVIYGSSMFERKICHSHGVHAKVRLLTSGS